MNLALIQISHAATPLVAAAAKKSSSSTTFFLFILLFAAMYFLWLRPQRKKLQAKQLAQVRSIAVGDEVVTQSGIVGTVVSLDDDRAEIQVSSGVVLTVVRAAIGRRVEPVVPEAPEADVEDATAYDSASDADVAQSEPQRGRLFKRRVRGEDA